MPNIRLILEYNGANFSGWQKQPNARSIQEELEKVLEISLKEKPGTLYASGRTDAGVHARGQVVNFSVSHEPDLHRLKHSVSSLMKYEVAVLDADIVPDDFDSRRNASSKQYSYRILYRSAPAVLDYGQVWHVPPPLNLELMQEQAALLVGEHDFSSFRAAGCSAKTTVREIIHSEFELKSDYLTYRVVGTGFLKQMVRNIVGTLVDMGRDKLEIKSILEILEYKDRTKAGVTAPPHGLCLDWVSYK